MSFGNSTFVALPEPGNVITRAIKSDDGIYWEAERNIPNNNLTWISLAYGNSVWVGVSFTTYNSSISKIMYSNDISE